MANEQETFARRVLGPRVVVILFQAARLSYQNKRSESKMSPGRGNAWATVGESPHCLATRTNLLYARARQVAAITSVTLLPLTFHCIKV